MDKIPEMALSDLISSVSGGRKTPRNIARIRRRFDALYSKVAAMCCDDELHYTEDAEFLFVALFQVACLEFVVNPTYRAAKKWVAEEATKSALALALFNRHHRCLELLYEITTDDETGGVLKDGFLEVPILSLLRFRHTVELLVLSWEYANEGLSTDRSIAAAWDTYGSNEWEDILAAFLSPNDLKVAKGRRYFPPVTSTGNGPDD